MTTTVKKSATKVSEADKKILKSYVAQSYLYKKYSVLKADTKEIALGIFARAKTNVIIIDNKSYVQKIERSQRRFDSSKFIEYVKQSKDKNLQLLINSFYKNVPTVELKPFDNALDNALRSDLNAKR
jgi:hypothetical protein